MSVEEVEQLIAKGAALLKQKRPAEALTVYERALAQHPSDHWLWNKKGLVLAYHLNRSEEGLAAFERAIALAPVLRPWHCIRTSPTPMNTWGTSCCPSSAIRRRSRCLSSCWI